MTKFSVKSMEGGEFMILMEDGGSELPVARVCRSPEGVCDDVIDIYCDLTLNELESVIRVAKTATEVKADGSCQKEKH